MRGNRQAFPTPRGDGKSDPKGGVARLPGGQGRVPPRLRYAGDAPAAPGVVARRLWCMHTTARRAPSRKPRNAVVWVQFS